MKAEIGDFLVVKGSAAKHHDHRALITEVRSADGSPPYVVRWLDDDRVATVFTRAGRDRGHGAGTTRG